MHRLDAAFLQPAFKQTIEKIEVNPDETVDLQLDDGI